MLLEVSVKNRPLVCWEAARYLRFPMQLSAHRSTLWNWWVYLV